MLLSLLPLAIPAAAQNPEVKPAVKATPAKSLAGMWKGTLNTGAIELRLVLHLTQKADGTLSGTLDSPDQNVAGIALTKGLVKGDTVSLEIASISGVYEGKLSGAGDTISGDWMQGGASLPMTLTRTTQAALELERPQTPKKPYPYKEEEVTYENKAAKIKLAGTLTLPKGNGQFPVALLITGSGAQDRNESLLGHQPFLVLADYLTRQGIAVLRVDDRGIGGSTGDFTASTSEDFAGDVMSGVEYLKTRKEIDPKQIGLIGHSEGGLIAPAVASRSKDIAFIVLMAGPGLPGSDILTMQTRLITKASGVPDEAIAFNLKMQERMFAVAKSEKDNDKAIAKMKAEWTKIKAGESEARQKELDSIDATIEPQLRVLLAPWMRYFLAYDPRPALKQITCPILAINGELDLQVPPKEDLAEIEKALKAGGNKDYTMVLLPKLNHLFQTATNGNPQEYGKIKETIAPLALKTMGDWIVKHTAK